MARYLERRWDPLRDLASMHEDMNRLFGEVLGGPAGANAMSGSWMPLLDAHETADAFVVTVDLPGLSSDQVDVTIDQNVLTISGERRWPGDGKEDQYHRIERRYGRFQRSLTLPALVDPDGIQATFTDGVLEVVVPKAEQAKPRKIKIAEGARQLTS